MDKAALNPLGAKVSSAGIKGEHDSILSLYLFGFASDKQSFSTLEQ